MSERKERKPFRLFEQWGGDDKYFRLAQSAIMWFGIAVTAYIIFG